MNARVDDTALDAQDELFDTAFGMPNLKPNRAEGSNDNNPTHGIEIEQSRRAALPGTGQGMGKSSCR